MRNFDRLKFEFLEESALQDSLFSIARVLLKTIAKIDGVKGAVFLYSPPQSTFFEKVASMGEFNHHQADWDHCPLQSPLLLPQAIRMGIQQLVKSAENGNVESVAFPLGEVNFCFLGFQVDFHSKNVPKEETFQFLQFLAKHARSLLELNPGEGV